jgi:hypothetical protein
MGGGATDAVSYLVSDEFWRLRSSFLFFAGAIEGGAAGCDVASIGSMSGCDAD